MVSLVCVLGKSLFTRLAASPPFLMMTDDGVPPVLLACRGGETGERVASIQLPEVANLDV